MRELIYTQTHPSLGNLKGVLRIVGKTLFFKFNNSQQAATVIAQLQSKGALIETAGGWIKVDMFSNIEKDNQNSILNGKEFDSKTLPPEEIEKELFDFYYNQFTKAKFKVEVV